jgi:hypothetical protein
LPGRLDDPGRHQLLEDRVLAAGPIEPELAAEAGMPWLTIV